MPAAGAALWIVLACLQAPDAPRPASIAGRVVDADSGRPIAGVTDAIVGAVPGGGVTIGRSRNVTLTVRVTLLTDAVTRIVPAVLLESVTVATPLVVVLTTFWS